MISNKDNLFKNVNIPALSLLAQKLPDFDARSSITSKTFRGQNLKKKDKMKIRQEVWLSSKYCALYIMVICNTALSVLLWILDCTDQNLSLGQLVAMRLSNLRPLWTNNGCRFFIS